MTSEGNAVPALRTARLVLAEVDEGNIDELLSIRLADPDRVTRTEGPGGYDRAMFERDLMVAYMDPERVLFVVRQARDGSAVGLADVLRRHPEDGFFWIGGVEIQPSARRQGFGREVAEALAEWAVQLKQPSMRCAVDEDDQQALGFVENLGFRAASVSERRGPAGPISVHVYERELDARG